jgi:Fe2+ transport system protein FeoA
MIRTLEQLKDGQEAVVRSIQGGHGVRQRLSQCGVHPGDRLRVIQNGFFGGPVLINIHGVEVAIGQGMACKVEVEVAEPR